MFFLNFHASQGEQLYVISDFEGTSLSNVTAWRHLSATLKKSRMFIFPNPILNFHPDVF